MTLVNNLPVEQEVEFIIYDVIGNTIAKTILEKGLSQKQIDLTEVSAGVYYYRVTVNGIVVKTDKIVIVK